MQGFKASTDIASLRKLAAETGIELRKYSRLAFRQLLIHRLPLRELLEYLENPCLNDPKARNLRFFLSRKWHNGMNDGETIEFVDGICPWLELQISLGNMSEEDIMDILRFVSVVSGMGEDESLKCRLAGAVIGGISKSHVFGLTDISPTCATEILGCLMVGAFTQQSQSLGCNLINGLQESQVKQMAPGISKFFLRIFRSKTSLEQTEFASFAEVEVTKMCLMMLQRFSTQVKRSVVVKTSKMLILFDASVLHQSAWLKLLDLWWSQLVKLDLFPLVSHLSQYSGIYGLMRSQSVEVLAPYLRHLNDYRKVYFLLRWRWTVSEQDLLRFEKIHRLEKNVDPFLIMLKILHESARFRPRSLPRLFRLLQTMGMSHTIIKMMSTARNSGIPIPTDAIFSAVRNHLEVDPYYSRKIFRSDPRLPIEECPELVEELIKNSQLHPNAVWTYIKPRCNRQAAISDDLRTWRKRRAEMYERTALGFARKVQLTPRMRFRHVHKCYVQWKKERLGPVSTAISLALTWSGIIAPLQRMEWPSTTKIRWILSVVRAVEGATSADDIDRIVYKWRGDIIKHSKARTRRQGICGNNHRQLSHDFRRRWSKRRRRYEIVPKQLKRPDLQD